MLNLLNNIPAEMREYAQWIVWRYEEVAGGKPTKVPYCPRTGNLAAVNNPNTWATFEVAVNALMSGHYSGLGFVFTETDKFGGIDLDATQDSTALARQIKIFQEFNSYSERSPSGNGLHIIIKGHIPSGRRRSSIEVYSSGRFFTMTGDVYHNVPIAERQELFTMLWQQMGGPSSTSTYTGDSPQTEEDHEVIERACKAVNGDKFAALLEGRWNDYYPSQSEADFAFVDIVAFYTQNRAQIARIFRASPLGQRDKAKRRDYVDYMINKSFDRMLPPVDIEGLGNDLNQAIAERTAIQPGAVSYVDGGKVTTMVAPELPPVAPMRAAPMDAPFTVPVNPYTIPPGLLGELAQFFYQASPRPIPEISLAAAIGLMAGVCGQGFNVSNTGLNLYLMLLAPTGRGKEAIASGIDKIMNAIRTQVPAASQFRGPAEIASGQALIKYMDKSPSFVSVVGEFGYRLQSMASRHASASDLALKRTLLDLYNKSGHTQVFHPMIYSDKDKNTIAIPSPALTLLGESTPSTFYGIVDEQMIEDGLLPRFIIMEYDGERPPLNEAHATAFPTFHLVEQFGNLAANCLSLTKGPDGQRRVVHVDQDEGATELLRQFDKYADYQMNNNTKEVVQHLWNRAHINVLRLAALVAVGCHQYKPCISAENVVWARGIVVHAINRIMQRFEMGMIGRNSEESKQAADITRVIREYLTSDYATVAKYGAAANLHNDRIVPYSYINKRLVAAAAFRNDKVGATNAIKRTIQTLIDSGTIREIGKGELAKNYGTAQRAFMLTDMNVIRS